MAGKAGAIRAGRAFVELGTRDKLTAGLKRAQARLKAFGAGVRAKGVKLAAAGAIPLAVFGLASKIFAKTGDSLDKMSRRTGISVEALSELQFAAEQSGADLETLEKGVRTMQRASNDLSRGLSTQVDAFGDLGLEMANLAGRSPEQQFKLIAERLSQVEDASKRAALAQQIFGRAGTRLLPLMEDGAAGIERYQAEARRMGLTISTQTAVQAAELTDRMNILRLLMRRAAVEIGTSLAPMLIRAAQATAKAVKAATDWIKRNKPLLVSIAKISAIVTLSGIGLIALGAAFGIAGAAIGGLVAVVGVATSVLGVILSPIGAVVAAVVGLGVVIVKYTDIGGRALRWLQDRFSDLRQFVGEVMGGISDALASGNLALAGEIALTALRVVFITAMSKIKSIWTTWVSDLTGKLLSLETASKSILDRIRTNAEGLADTVVTNTAAAIISLQGSGTPNIVEGRELTEDEMAQASLLLLDGLEQRREDRKSGFSSREHQRRSDLDADLAENTARLDSDLAEADASLAAAVAELKKLRADAAKGRQDSAAASRAGRPEIEGLDGLDSLLDGVGQTLATKAKGTFNALAAQSLLGGGNAADRTAKATEATSKNTKRMIQILGEITGTFA